MHQIKLFKGIETELGALESEVNTWLAETEVTVHSVNGRIAPQTPGREGGSAATARFAPSDVLVTIWYETKG